MKLPKLFALSLVCFLAVGAAGEKKLEVKIYPLLSVHPADVRVTVRIPPSERNIAYLAEIDGADMFQGSTYPLDGENSAPTRPAIWFKGLPAGDYDVTVILYRAEIPSEVARVHQHVTVN